MHTVHTQLHTPIRDLQSQVLDAEGADHALSHTINVALNAAAVIDRCTLWPWVVTVTSGIDGVYSSATHIVQRALSDAPQGEDLIPAGAEFLRADVFPATRFDDMANDVRRNYKQHYRAFLMWRKARAAEKSPAQMRPWVDYDPCAIDETVERWAIRGVRYSGG